MRTRGTLSALGAIAALVLLAAAPAEASFPGENGRIAFADFNSGQIYSTNPDGSALRQLTDTRRGTATDYPSWSADGEHILFTKFRLRGGDDHARIWIMNADGSDETQVARDTPGFRDYTPKFTPDERHIVFTRCKPNDGVCAIWKMRADGTHKHALTPYVEPPGNESIDFDLSVSPDGKHVAFARFAEGGFNARIFVMDIDGSDEEALTPPRLEGFAPDWSPDGERVAFSNKGPRPGSSIFSIRADGSDVERITENHLPFNDFQGGYSPDGDRLAFSSDRNHPDGCCVELFAIDADGDDESLVDTGLSPPGVLNADWGTARCCRGARGWPVPRNREPPPRAVRRGAFRSARAAKRPWRSARARGGSPRAG